MINAFRFWFIQKISFPSFCFDPSPPGAGFFAVSHAFFRLVGPRSPFSSLSRLPFSIRIKFLFIVYNLHIFFTFLLLLFPIALVPNVQWAVSGDHGSDDLGLVVGLCAFRFCFLFPFSCWNSNCEAVLRSMLGSVRREEGFAFYFPMCLPHFLLFFFNTRSILGYDAIE